MKTCITFKNEQRRQLPEAFRNDDVRYAEELVEYFLAHFTEEGAIVLDPFMGFGTTLLVAERMNRIAYGVEFDADRCQYVKSILAHPERALHGDSTKLKDLDLPDFDLSITSPPYMGKHHKENPFTAYSTNFSGYAEYLATLGSIYSQINTKLNPGGRVVIEVSNLKHEDGSFTTLAWDIASAVSAVLKFMGEIVVTWEGGYAYGYDHSYCLVFGKADSAV